MSDKIKPKIISDSDTLHQLAQSSILITHNPQLANDWKRRYSSKQSMPACETPRIYTWSAWLSELFQQTSDKVCLKDMQEQLLWQHIIKNDVPHIAESSIRGLAKQAMQAYALLQSYQVPLQTLSQAGGDEAEALARWIEHIHHQLTQACYQSYTLKADIAALLLNDDIHLTLPTSIILDGFEHYTPIQAQHLQMYAKAGISIYQVQRTRTAHAMTLTPCQDEHAEYQHIALQTQAILKQQSQARIALINTQTNQETAFSTLQRYMQKNLNPESCLHPDIQVKTITMQGEVLADTAMVQQALHLLSQCMRRDMPFEDFSPLLFCPWLRGFEQERMARATLDARFRQQNRHHIQLKSLLKSSETQKTPVFKHVIEVISTWQQSAPKKQSAAHWIKACQHLLQQCGFIQAGQEHEAVRSRYEIQLMNALHDSLTNLIALDAIQKEYSWREFLTWLRSSCAQIQVPQEVSFNNISVLNMQQAIGMQFDYVFILGMDNASFPPAARPQGFIPIRIQQDYHMPMSHGALVFESSHWLWQQMQYTAPHIMVSYALVRDEQAMQACSFVTELPEANALVEHETIESWASEDFDDTQTIPVSSGTHIRGGTAIIKHQSACPFRAFAVHRLRIEALGETTPGIEASSKGSLIHLALEYIWQQLLSQQKLLDMNTEQQQKLIYDSIEHAWENNKKPINFNDQAIERKRMFVLLQQWLALECTRPAFQIEALEKTYQLSLPSGSEPALPITIKADRMDKDVHGHRMLIDYKTGQKQSSGKWLGERIAEPQLPMYALAAQLTAEDAVSFASVRSGDDMGFEGLSGHDMGIKGLTLCDGKRSHPDDWQAVLETWREQIDALAHEFMQGRSDVSPRDKSACDYCKLEAICRIDELKSEVKA
ncbi:MAG: exodeoxyribonuclease V subunit gamma [Mariprofundaceae bacterium]|nr:exodeoxyribonuclease V subunit gamma [Mariprofundaceae bacterium]